MAVAGGVQWIVGVQTIVGDLDLRMACTQLLDIGPVGGGTPAIEQAGGGEDQRAGTHRTEAAHLGGGLAQPGQQWLVLTLRLFTQAARNKQGVDLRRIGLAPGLLGHQLKAGRGGNCSGLLSEYQQAIERRQALTLTLVIGRGEDLQRTAQIQAHDIGVEQAGDGLQGIHGGVLERRWMQCAPIE